MVKVHLSHLKSPQFTSFSLIILENAIHNSVSSLTITKKVYSLYFYRKCSIVKGVTTGPESHPVNTGDLLGVKRRGCEADHSTPSKVEFKNKWRYSSTSRHNFVAWARTSSLIMQTVGCWWRRHYMKSCRKYQIIVHSPSSLKHFTFEDIKIKIKHFLLLKRYTSNR